MRDANRQKISTGRRYQTRIESLLPHLRHLLRPWIILQGRLRRKPLRCTFVHYIVVKHAINALPVCAKSSVALSVFYCVWHPPPAFCHVLPCARPIPVHNLPLTRRQVPVQNQVAWDVIISIIFCVIFAFIGFMAIREFMDMRRGMIPKIVFD